MSGMDFFRSLGTSEEISSSIEVQADMVSNINDQANALKVANILNDITAQF